MLAAGLIKDEPGIQRLDIPEPKKPHGRDVLVQIKEAAIDGTDETMLKFQLVDSPENENRLVLGHEAVGQVLAVGEDVEYLREGDIVVPTVRRGCNLCASCLHGQSDMCATGLYTERGIHKLHGFFTLTIIEREEYLVKCPPGSEDVAVLAEPLSIGIKALEQIKYIQSRLPWSCTHPGHRYDEPGWGGCKSALVIGAGPLGILAAALLIYEGIRTYVAVNRPEDNFRVQLVEKFGAHYVDSRNGSREEIVEQTGPLDIIIEASGASQFALDMIAGLGRNGIYVMTGIPRGKLEVCLDGHLLLRQITRQNQVVIGSVNSNRKHFIESLDLLVKMKDRYGDTFKSIITHRFPLDRMEEAFSLEEESIKVVFEP